MFSEGTVPRKRIIVVDDHPVVRHGMVELLGAQPEFEVCGEAADVADAVQLVESNKPDLLVVDLSLKHGHGIGLVERVTARHPEVKILVVSAHDESLFAERCLRAGAKGYIHKSESPEKLVEALREVARGQIYLSPEMSKFLLRQVVGRGNVEQNPIASLSNRELEVFEMIGRGLNTKQIATRLHLSAKTIETHREKIKAKLGLASGAELNQRAIVWVLEGSRADVAPSEPGGAAQPEE